MTKEQAIKLIEEELEFATKKFNKFNSAHEGIAVIEEEFLELRDTIFWANKNTPKHILESNKRVEATQLAAMALKFLIDFCNYKN